MRNRQSRRGWGEREHLRIRRKLLRELRDRAEKKGITFSVIARCCNTSQSRGWQLLNGPIEQFNSETLIDVLWRFGVTVDVVVTSRRNVPMRFGDPDAMEFPAAVRHAQRLKARRGAQGAQGSQGSVGDCIPNSGNEQGV